MKILKKFTFFGSNCDVIRASVDIEVVRVEDGSRLVGIANKVVGQLVVQRSILKAFVARRENRLKSGGIGHIID